ncbi:MAG: carbohydrate binding family 9 domain-containing protein [Gemmatimonadaceae bacterium]|nr:carbohydrate binding family 9 domain-containing protein [Gemmatimonadaceae bacterium]NUQ91492.1 carbohydrate binding family 9 domain-containing protein [Gemmatimonadaceae bacterium]NUR33941.1 carbohydrate binding family 9 domain-containing protein [Gemmatimonadaceae bacterium]NUS98346.1 carbohydrate binding family 9 domain-containing protein [Gemmatimonadaceae bacterium]
MRLRPPTLALLAATSAASLPAQQQPIGPAPAAAAGATVPMVASAVRADQPPVIDGREDDPVWRSAPARSDFLEFRPNEGKQPRFRTEFKAAYDDRNLYVFIRAFDPHPDSIMTALTRRDERGPSDQLKIMIDSYHDRRSGFEFAVNPVGVKRDYAMYNDSEEDQSWDGIWDVGTRIDSLGWTAEFRIPFSQLRYANMREHVFGFAIWRDIERYKERTSWPLYRANQSGISSQLGDLRGVVDISAFRRLEVVPYVVMKNIGVPNTSAPSDVQDWYRSDRLTAGADVKYGLTPNLTLDATVNPDFGQVEADPSVLNLSAFETFFQEKRPFFIEGTGLYNFGLNCSIVNCSSEGLFYSRRIGRSPQLLGWYGDAGSAAVTPIIGAAKLTGRLANGLNVGVLDAVTGRVAGVAERTTEPRSNYTVLRATQELRQGATSIGVIATGVNRSLDQWSDTLLHRDAYAGGVDFRHRFGKSRYELSGSVTQSFVEGSHHAIWRTQRSGVHNYQRPDDRLTVDSSRTSLSGDGEEITFGKFGGNRIHFQTSYERQSPGYEVNDLGYLRRANQQLFNNWMGINWTKPTRLYRQMSGNFNTWYAWTADGLPTERAVNTNWHVNFANNWWMHTGATLDQLPGTYCDNCARGGPAFARSPFLGVNLGIQGDDRRRVVPSVFTFVGRGDYGASHYVEVSPELQLIPMSQLQIDISPYWSMNHDDSQWLGNFTDNAGTHYTFAHLNQETRSVGLRTSFTATPTLSFQLYAAPFWSRGRYTNTRELSATPRAARYEDRYTPYAVSDSSSLSFDVMQLHSNSVLRWEFRPGSTIFAVWTHGRDGGADFVPGRRWRDEYSDLFAVHPDNTFLVKIAYWLD